MKRYLFLLLLLIAFSLLVAAESQPSATVGYFKKTIDNGGWEAFSLPFSYSDLSPNAILGDQFGDFDMLIDMTDPMGPNAMYLTGSGWVGGLTALTYGHSYWVNRDWSNPAAIYYLMGPVAPHAVTVHVSGTDEGNWSAFGLNEAAPVDLNTLVIPGALDFDMIIDISDPMGANAMYLTGSGWVGELTSIIPTHAYWYNSSADVSFNFNYPASRNETVIAPSVNVKPGIEHSKVTK
jgi:hypothetical protein